jgi:hypothetical protein
MMAAALIATVSRDTIVFLLASNKYEADGNKSPSGPELPVPFET